jgi:hypothetical protein
VRGAKKKRRRHVPQRPIRRRNTPTTTVYRRADVRSSSSDVRTFGTARAVPEATQMAKPKIETQALVT